MGFMRSSRVIAIAGLADTTRARLLFPAYVNAFWSDSNDAIPRLNLRSGEGFCFKVSSNKIRREVRFMVANPHFKFSYEDYKNLPESETARYELLEGEIVMVPSPSFEHQDISFGLSFALGKYVLENSLGKVVDAPLDVVLEEPGKYSVVQPDIIFISKERAKKIIRRGEIRGAPDLVIEILSAATAKRDRTTKKTLYARHSVTEYWLVDPTVKTIEVLKLTERGYRRVGIYTKKETLRSALLLGLEVPLKKIF
jgi:Uma2 family endonuclease